MRSRVAALLVLLLPPAAAADQLVVVTTASWEAKTGTLRRYQGAPGRWRAVGEAVPVVVGKGGLGWGTGLSGRPRGAEGPEKREGDGRAPAGLFALGEVTGYSEQAPVGLALAYRAATPSLRCVDDPRSPAYNRLAEAPGAWSSDEKMRRDDELYRLTVFVRHNPERQAGGGSCIFLHVWRDAAAPTVGCTAMALPALAELVVWLDPQAALVQLPRPVYERLRKSWKLP